MSASWRSHWNGEVCAWPPPSGLSAISPSRGEIIRFIVFANDQGCRVGGAPKLPISPL
ncbi:propionyl-coenzyme A carboxylase alpha polypeptide [Mesorhizobium sp. M8A.F.Ca.ET.165.01.1.1]|nr:propionyl-coenzyme A carboxylase alpha polypeptide [Mesorhizobium sp. M8A.F.Ca.ET.165.01.1.1]